MVAQCDAEFLVADNAHVQTVAQSEIARVVVQVRVEGRPLARVEGTASVGGGVIDLIVGCRTAAHVVLVVKVEHGVAQVAEVHFGRNQPVVALRVGGVVIDEVVAVIRSNKINIGNVTDVTVPKII